jgi:hypothetical protein
MTPRLMETYTKDIFGNLSPDELAAALRATTCVDLSEPARWLYDDPSREWLTYTDYPSLLPPWPTTWFEFKIPQWSHSGDEVIDLHPELIPRLGCLAVTDEHDENEGADVLRTDELLTRVEGYLGQRIPQPPEATALRQAHLADAIRRGTRCRWTVIFQSYFEAVHQLNRGATAGFYLDEQGRAILGTHFMVHDTDDPQMAEAENMMFTPIFFGIALLHCKNITTERIDVPEKVRRARVKKGMPDVQFRTLVVEPMRKQMRAASGGATGIKQALHWVRGSFATYGPERPMFGKLTGTFWRPLHAAGSPVQGAVVKDYEVVPPERRS